MGNLIASMGDAESVLLLYLADELSAEDRAQVDQALAHDAALHDTLARLSAMLEQCNSALAHLDHLDFEPTDNPADSQQAGMRLDRQAAVDRRAGDIVRQWISQPRVDAQPQRHRSRNAPLWTYPFAAAAAIILGFLIYWGRAPVTSPAVAQHDTMPAMTTLPAQTPMVASDNNAATNPANDVAIVDTPKLVTPILFPQSDLGAGNDQYMAFADSFNRIQSPDPANSGQPNDTPATTQGN